MGKLYEFEYSNSGVGGPAGCVGRPRKRRTEAIRTVGPTLKIERAPKASNDQATKGTRWMPWRRKAMKDVVSCDKLREAANRR